jgi:hypothetical protein
LALRIPCKGFALCGSLQFCDPIIHFPSPGT